MNQVSESTDIDDLKNKLIKAQEAARQAEKEFEEAWVSKKDRFGAAQKMKKAQQEELWAQDDLDAALKQVNE